MWTAQNSASPARARAVAQLVHDSLAGLLNEMEDVAGSDLGDLALGLAALLGLLEALRRCAPESSRSDDAFARGWFGDYQRSTSSSDTGFFGEGHLTYACIIARPWWHVARNLTPDSSERRAAGAKKSCVEV